MYTPVGASLLAIMANDNAVSLIPRGVLGFIASELVPTGSAVSSSDWPAPLPHRPCHQNC
ncbi:hypothetical protein C4E44_02465 [Pseudomonas sp. MWU12-2312b]|nr:hypothetical protein C4E44_02465 [Pseudomonas sp. MWU12-2312b]